MAPKKKGKSPLEKKLRSLEKEAALVSSDIKNISKALQKPGAKTLPPLKTASLQPPVPPKRAIPLSSPQKPSLELESDAIKDDTEAAYELWAWSKKAKKSRSTASSVSASSGVNLESHVSRTGRSAGHARVGRSLPGYLDSGSRGYRRVSRHDRNVHRNKAIFMLMVVLIVLYIVVKLAYR